MTAVKPKKDQRTKHELGLCGYCMKQMARQMVMLKRGPNAQYRRWICAPCVEKRMALGVIKPSSKPNEYERAR